MPTDTPFSRGVGAGVGSTTASDTPPGIPEEEGDGDHGGSGGGGGGEAAQRSAVFSQRLRHGLSLVATLPAVRRLRNFLNPNSRLPDSTSPMVLLGVRYERLQPQGSASTPTPPPPPPPPSTTMTTPAPPPTSKTCAELAGAEVRHVGVDASTSAAASEGGRGSIDGGDTGTGGDEEAAGNDESGEDDSEGEDGEGGEDGDIGTPTVVLPQESTAGAAVAAAAAALRRFTSGAAPPLATDPSPPAPTFAPAPAPVPTPAPIDEGLRGFADDFQSRVWITYRRGFPHIGASPYTTDAGWGCTLRSAQMLLANALSIHFFGRQWWGGLNHVFS